MIENFDLKKILKTALRNGGDFADIYSEEISSLQIISENKIVEKINPTFDHGVGIRIILKDLTAYGFTNDVTESGLMTLAQSVSENIKGSAPSKILDLTKRPSHLKLPILKSPLDLKIQNKKALIDEAEKAAWAFDKRIIQVKTLYADISKKIGIANSLGEWAEEERVYSLFYVQTVAQEKDMMQTGYYPVGGVCGLEMLDTTPPEMIAKKSAEQAIRMLQARKAPAGTMPVVISSSAGGTMVHEAVGHGLEADLASLGLSVYHKKVGQRIANEKITIVDDKTLTGKRGSFVFDDEGTPSEKTVLVEKGILKNYMYDRRLAMKDKTQSTGNGRRESYRFPPICRMTNTMIMPGTDDPEEIIRTTDTGLFVTKMGGGQVNTVNGDFVFEVNEAYLIEKGKVGAPVRGAMLMGNGPKVLDIIDRVGNDHGFSIGTCGKNNQGVPVSDAQPTIRIPELVVGGSS